MTPWLFPGQPLRREAALPDDDDFRAIERLCSERCGFELREHRPLPGRLLSEQTLLQLYGVALSLYRTRRLRAAGQRPDLIAEHSLGIYAALAACGSISEAEALELAARIGSCMAVMGQARCYALGCPVGLAVGPVEAAARNNGVYLANYNTSRHFLLAGEADKMAAALEECRLAGAFSVSAFACEAPLHTPLMAEIGGQLAAIVADYSYAEPTVPLLEHISQRMLSAAAMPAFLVDELQQPVWWERSWLKLRSLGAVRGCEVGSGSALSKFNRWIDSEVTP